MMAKIERVPTNVRRKFFYQSSYAYIGLFLFSEFNPRKPDLMGYTVSAEKLYMHPNYTKRFDWDFCLIKLSQALVFDRKVKPIGGVLKIQNQS